MRFPEFDGEWETHRLGELVEIKSGVSPTGIIDENGLFPFYKVEQLNNCYVELNETPYLTMQSSVPVHGIIFPKRGAAIMTNKIRIASKPCQLDTNLMALIIENNEKVDYKFLFYFIARYNLSKIADTSTIPQINNIHINPLKITLPSFKEQQKISALLTVLDLKIDTQRKIIEDLKKLKDAINNSLHNNINEFQLFSFNEMGNDYSGLTGKSSGDFGSGLPYISYLNVFRNGIITDGPFDCVKVSKTEKQNIVNYGDLLFTLSSETPSEVGIGAIYLGKTTPLYLNSFCFGVHLSNQEKIYGPYLAYFVTSQYFRRTILPFAQGSTRYNLMKSDFMKHKFCFPNMASQKAIYNALHALSEKIQNEEVCLNKYTEQKRYLLTRLFI